MKSDLLYLGHIADSIAAIETCVAGGREIFLRERLIQDAVVRNSRLSAKRLADCLCRRGNLPPPHGARSSPSEIA